MKLWMVRRYGWGLEFNLIQAETRELAVEAAIGRPIYAGWRGEVEEIDTSKGPVLWTYENSPDSVRD